MAVTVKKVVLWRKEAENRTGILANALAPLAHAGTDIHVVMAYRFQGQESKAQLSFIRLRGGSPLQRPRKPDSARQPSRLCSSRATTEHDLATKPRRPSRMRESTWIFLWPRLWKENIQRFLDLSLTQTPQSALP